ncbi:MAG TPA: hypothetical protein VL793_03310, partial [Patescibacteria group bacterium]|nr:hypothetical protein [Patescibacteria group bacterium]
RHADVAPGITGGRECVCVGLQNLAAQCIAAAQIGPQQSAPAFRGWIPVEALEPEPDAVANKSAQTLSGIRRHSWNK